MLSNVSLYSARALPLLLIFVTSCIASEIDDSSDPDAVCGIGDTRECVCAGGLRGGQECLEDMSGWTTCDCGLPEGDGDADGDADGDVDGDVDGDGDGDASRELCDDGLDNDGDGEVDEDCECTVGTTQGCYAGAPEQAGMGACTMGLQTCVESDEFGGGWGACEGSVMPAEELCNGADEDCDGVVDNGCSCVEGETEPCYDGPVGTAGVGTCQEGFRTCDINGNWGACEGQILPAEQLCTGHDQDCDGEIDEGCCHDVNICGGGLDLCNETVQEARADCLAAGCTWGGPDVCTIGGSVSNPSAYGALVHCF